MPNRFVVQFDCFRTIDAADRVGGELFELLFEATGTWPSPARFAVCADWQLDDPSRGPELEHSRRELFDLRRQHLPAFTCDWLLRRLDVPGSYTVLGLYGNEEGLRGSRAHPMGQTFAAHHAASALGAIDISSLQFFRIPSQSAANW